VRDLNSAVCDLHHLGPLYRVAIAFGSGHEAPQEAALHCPNVDCERCYSPERGYFLAKEGQYIDQGVPSKKAQCRHGSEPVYMVLTLNNGELLWACLADGCQASREYQTQHV
jgi:hypothetical protein